MTKTAYLIFSAIFIIINVVILIALWHDDTLILDMKFDVQTPMLACSLNC